MRLRKRSSHSEEGQEVFRGNEILVVLDDLSSVDVEKKKIFHNIESDVEVGDHLSLQLS